MFSKSCQYALRAVVYIAEKSIKQQRVGLKEIATKIESPEPYTAKILQLLSQNKIIVSQRGVGGGFTIDPKRLQYLSIADVVKAIDGDKIFSGCSLGLSECSDLHPCPLHSHFVETRKALEEKLEQLTIETLAESYLAGHSYLKI